MHADVVGGRQGEQFKFVKIEEEESRTSGSGSETRDDGEGVVSSHFWTNVLRDR